MKRAAHRARTGHRVRWFGAVVGLVMIASVGVGAQSASASTHSATKTGEHSVCAQTLNQYVWEKDSVGGIKLNTYVATNGTGYYITQFVKKSNLVYGYSRGTHKWGYVYNGWFC